MSGEKRKSRLLKRRKLLRSGIMVAGAGFVPISGVADAKSIESDIISRGGVARDEALDIAISEAEKSGLIENSDQVDYMDSEVNAFRANHQNSEWTVVSALIKTEKKKKSHLVWSTHDLAEPNLFEIEGSPPSGSSDEPNYLDDRSKSVTPIALPICGTWDEMPDPYCVEETVYAYSGQIYSCGKCARHLSKIDWKDIKSRKAALDLVVALPSCVSCVVGMVKEGFDEGIPCDLCIPEDEFWYSGGEREEI